MVNLIYQPEVLEDSKETMTALAGELCGTEVRGEFIDLWFQSPTGDQSDSQILTIRCRDYRQARQVEALHREKWGLAPAVIPPPRDMTHQEEVKVLELLKEW
jgi:hypothetical protein